LQRELSTIPGCLWRAVKGSPEEPAIVKRVSQSVKLVDNKPLTRPVWYLDVNQQGEGIVDVTTHLVDLVQWEAFPDQIIDYKKDIELIDANRWTTSISPEEFKQVTGTDAYPDFLKKDVENDTLKVYCNGDIVYKIKGVTAKVSVIWNYTFPKGGGDYPLLRHEG
jgi:Osmosensitive K+ channel histidine kinase